jgi:hypothetical protein
MLVEIELWDGLRAWVDPRRVSAVFPVSAEHSAVLIDGQRLKVAGTVDVVGKLLAELVDELNRRDTLHRKEKGHAAVR